VAQLRLNNTRALDSIRMTIQPSTTSSINPTVWRPAGYLAHVPSSQGSISSVPQHEIPDTKKAAELCSTIPKGQFSYCDPYLKPRYCTVMYIRRPGRNTTQPCAHADLRGVGVRPLRGGGRWLFRLSVLALLAILGRRGTDSDRDIAQARRMIAR
jgi:hypothetical protein